MSRPSSGDDLPTDRRVARYQAELLRILHSGGEGVDMAEKIASACADLDTSPRELDPTLIEVAADLTRTWGRLRD